MSSEIVFPSYLTEISQNNVFSLSFGPFGNIAFSSGSIVNFAYINNDHQIKQSFSISAGPVTVTSLEFSLNFPIIFIGDTQGNILIFDYQQHKFLGHPPFVKGCYYVQQMQCVNDKLFVFYVPSPFIFVCVSSVKLPVKLILQELKHLESIITSLLSYGFKRLLAVRPNYDIKNETQSTERLFTSMLENMDTSHTFVFYDCVPMCGITKVRNQFKKIIKENYSPDVYSIIVFFRGEVLCQINSKHFEVSCDDILISE